MAPWVKKEAVLADAHIDEYSVFLTFQYYKCKCIV